MNRLSRRLGRSQGAGGIKRTKSRHEAESEGIRKSKSLGRRISRTFGVEEFIFQPELTKEEQFEKDMRDIVETEAAKPNDRSIFDPPYEILEHMYLGTSNQARDISGLKQVGITHVINFAPNNMKNDTSKESMERAGLKYLEFPCRDDDTYDMGQHFADAYRFIEEARTEGKILLYSMKGLNTSGYIAVAYTMIYKKIDLLQALRLCAEKRGILLMNANFRKQLYIFAKEQDMLEYLPF